MSGLLRTGVLLMTYGSPRDLDDVPAYLVKIRGGRPAGDDLVEEFKRRYARIGMSPLIEITQRQATGLERALGDGASPGGEAGRSPGEGSSHSSGASPAGEALPLTPTLSPRERGFVVRAGMRFSDPTVEDAARELAEAGAERLLGVVLSPQYSPIIMGGYRRALEATAARVGLPCRLVEAWHLEPAFVRVLADGVRAGLDRFPAGVREQVPVLLTAHSLPKRVVDEEPQYVDQLKETAVAVAEAAGLAPERWQFVYQSAGHTPEEWLKPDLLDVLPVLAAEGHKQVLIAPVQFLADHLETLYDIDVAGGEQADAAGVEAFVRVPAPNDAPDFAEALADVVRRAVGEWDDVAARDVVGIAAGR